MPRWDPDSYLSFADHRARPFVELLARIPPGLRAARIADLGCGPGHLTTLLRDRWPDADIDGVDSSAEMIERAMTEGGGPRVRYHLSDLATWAPAEPVDLMISNATFQWVPDATAVIRRLSDHLTEHGCMAISVPNNFAGPSHRLLHEISSRQPYADHTTDLHQARGRDPRDLLSLWAEAGWSVDAWSTTYLQILPGPDPVLRWISGTGARPILQALPEPLRSRFIEEYRIALQEAYPPQSYGTVLPFERTFCVATRGTGPSATGSPRDD